ncbi:MAG: hypothetical protein ACOVSR_05845 [Bacteroidia bacterium]
MRRDHKKHTENKPIKDTKDLKLTTFDEKDNELVDVLLYPPSDDVYNNLVEETNIDPEDITKNKRMVEEAGEWNEKDFDEDMAGDDLDVPGSELDDEQEDIGNEDEENNYYSLGGDNHVD